MDIEQVSPEMVAAEAWAAAFGRDAVFRRLADDSTAESARAYLTAVATAVRAEQFATPARVTGLAFQLLPADEATIEDAYAVLRPGAPQRAVDERRNWDDARASLPRLGVLVGLAVAGGSG